MVRGLLLFALLLSLAPVPAAASDIDAMSVLRGAVKDFYALKTLDAKLERTRISGVGRVKKTTFMVRYQHPDRFFLESIEPAGYVQAVREGGLVAWNIGAKQGYQGKVEELSNEQRDQLLLVPGFRLNPLIPINPRAYDLRARAAGKSRVTVTFTAKQGKAPPIEMDFLTEPYRVSAVRIDHGDWRLETTYENWRQENGAWMFGQMRTVKWENRLQSEESFRFYDVKLNGELPPAWLPERLPDGFQKIGREFFTPEAQ